MQCTSFATTGLLCAAPFFIRPCCALTRLHSTAPDLTSLNCCTRRLNFYRTESRTVNDIAMGLCYSRKPPLSGISPALPPVDPTQIAAGRQPVYLHIYDLLVLNYTSGPMGLGVYHTGVQVYEDGERRASEQVSRASALLLPPLRAAHVSCPCARVCLCVSLCLGLEYCFSGHTQVDSSSGEELTGLRAFRPPTDTSWIEDAIYKSNTLTTT